MGNVGRELKTVLANQLAAALCTLSRCIDRCPQDAWQMPIANLTFDQVAFHTLFFTDYYLGRNAGALRPQPFHRNHVDAFAEYEELEDRPQEMHYDRTFIEEYMQHCHEKAARVIGSETDESLSAKADFERRDFSRAELYVLTVRHIQHHAAHLSLRLRLDAGLEIPWAGSGWRDAPA